MEVMTKLLKEIIITLKHQRKKTRNGKSGKHSVRCRAIFCLLFLKFQLSLKLLTMFHVQYTDGNFLELVTVFWSFRNFYRKHFVNVDVISHIKHELDHTFETSVKILTVISEYTLQHFCHFVLIFGSLCSYHSKFLMVNYEGWGGFTWVKAYKTRSLCRDAEAERWGAWSTRTSAGLITYTSEEISEIMHYFGFLLEVNEHDLCRKKKLWHERPRRKKLLL